MMIDLEERTAWKFANIVVLVGPGGVGKSSVGHELAPLLGRDLIDLDTEFLRRVGDIGSYIRCEGYEQYKVANSKLASDLTNDTITPSVLVTSSGFLTLDNPSSTLDANRRLVARCFSVCLLPSRDLETTVNTIVERQMARPFTSEQSKEEATIRDRYPIYARLGDLIVFSTASPPAIAREIAHRLSGIHFS